MRHEQFLENGTVHVPLFLLGKGQQYEMRQTFGNEAEKHTYASVGRFE